MLPFFSQAVIPGYRVYRPGWLLGVLLALIFTHLLLELAHAYVWLWLVDAPLALLSAWLSVALAIMGSAQSAPAVRAASGLCLADKVASALYTLQSAWFAASGDFILARAPVHALTVGFFGVCWWPW